MRKHNVVNSVLCAALSVVAIAWAISLASPLFKKPDVASDKSLLGAPQIGVSVCKPSAPAKSYRVSPVEKNQRTENISTFVVTCADGSKQILSVEQRVLLNSKATALQK